jgi:hypothetical protein
VREVKSKVLVIIVALMAAAMLLTPMVGSTEARVSRRIQEDCEDFEVNLTTQIDPSNIEVIDKGYKIILRWNETMTAYTINIDGKEYTLFEDFTYTGFATFTAWKPTGEAHPVLGFPIGEYMEFEVKYMYDFSAVPGGIDGRLRMHAITRMKNASDLTVGGTMEIRSVYGTGDLRNVKVKATNGGPGNPSHVGTVCGWPDIETFDTVLVPGTHIPFPGYPKYWPSEEDAEILFNKVTENMTNYRLVIGDETYVMGTDFTYDGIIKIRNPIAEPYLFMNVKYTYTFLPISGIDGALKMEADMTYWPATDTTPPVFEGNMKGYGTGDLRGVVVKAEPGSAIIDPEFGPALTHVGKVYGWPDMQYFQLVPSGGADPETGVEWVYPKPPADPESAHVRNREWVIGDTLTLTVGDDTYTMGGDPIDISYYGEFDSDTVFGEEVNVTKVRVRETITVSVMGEEIGKLKLLITSESSATGYAGSVVGYGTGVFKGVKIVAADQVVLVSLDPLVFTLARTGKVTNWPSIETVTKDPAVDPADMSFSQSRAIALPENEFFCNGTISIEKGGIREFNYTGALGTGRLTWEQVIAKSHVGGGYVEFPPNSGQLANVTGYGWGFYKAKLVIDDGPYGTGTLTGTMRAEVRWEVYVHFTGHPKAIFEYGTGDFKGMKVYLEGINMNFVIWFNTTIIS